MAFGRKKIGATREDVTKRFQAQKSGAGFGRANSAAQAEAPLWKGAKSGLTSNVANSIGIGHNARIDRVINLLQKSPTGAALFEEAQKDGVVFELDRHLGSSGAYGGYDNNAATITLNSGNSVADNVNSLAHELRHHWQNKNGLRRDSSKTPQENITMTRLREADAEAVSLQVSGELFQNGYKDSFLAHKKSIFSGMADAYMEKNFEDRANIKNGQSMKAAFDAWFDYKPMVDSYDNDSLSQMDATYRKATDTPSVKFSSEALMGFGKLPNGFNYLDQADGTDLTSKPYNNDVSDENKADLQQAENRYSSAKTTSSTPQEKPRDSATPMLGGKKQKSFGRRTGGMAKKTKINTLNYQKKSE